MNRRHFLKQGGLGALGLPVVLNGISFNSLANSKLMQALSAVTATDRILVLIQLHGGNDGLNMVIPTSEYSYLSQSSNSGGRADILIDENAVLQFMYNGVQQHAGTGLHPAMQALSNLYTDGHLGIIQGVGYPNPSFSHFRATDIVLSGSDSNVYEDTGWIGRYLNNEHPNYATTPPADPLAITIGAIGSNVYNGPDMNMGIAVQNSQTTGYLSGNVDIAPNNLYGYELTHIRNIAQQSNTYATAISNAYNNGGNVATYPANNPLAQQLQTVARLIKGDLGSNFYMVNMGSFDTHDGQVNASDPTTGWHANLLGQLSEAIAAFMTDLGSMSNSVGAMDERVLGLTVSEFGRTINANGNHGTDHGTTAPMLLFGKHVNPDILGSNPTIWDASQGAIKDDLDMQFDFRSVYGSIFHQWFNLSTPVVDSLLNKSFQDGSQPGQDIFDGGFHCNLPLFKSTFTPIISSIKDSAALSNVVLYPNPTSDGVIRFKEVTLGTQYEVAITTTAGQEVFRQKMAASALAAGLDCDLSSGSYTVSLQNKTHQRNFALQVL